MAYEPGSLVKVTYLEDMNSTTKDVVVLAGTFPGRVLSVSGERQQFVRLRLRHKGAMEAEDIVYDVEKDQDLTYGVPVVFDDDD